MNDLVELILSTYQSMRPLDAERAADSRQKISRYIESLASVGQRDAEQLAIYGLAYLTNCTRGTILGSPAAKRQTRCFQMPGRLASCRAGPAAFPTSESAPGLPVGRAASDPTGWR
jgi:hypothetical protein